MFNKNIVCWIHNYLFSLINFVCGCVCCVLINLMKQKQLLKEFIKEALGDGYSDEHIDKYFQILQAKQIMNVRSLQNLVDEDWKTLKQDDTLRFVIETIKAHVNKS